MCQCGHGYDHHAMPRHAFDVRGRCKSCRCDCYEAARPSRVDVATYYGLTVEQLAKVL